LPSWGNRQFFLAALKDADVMEYTQVLTEGREQEF
jgi:hypothetical protein